MEIFKQDTKLARLNTRTVTPEAHTERWTSMSRGGYALFHDSPKRPLKVEGARRGHRERLRRQCIQSCGFLRLGKPGERAPKIVYALSIEVSDGNT